MRLEYSAPLALETDMAGLCQALRAALAETGVFPLAGIRVRAFAADAYAMTDGNRDDRFLAMVLTVGEGRSEAALHEAGAHVFKVAKAHLADLMARGHLALSLDIAESRSALSFKDNPIHARLSARKA
nr:5-carboxymethyl-2-hydroxymuconate isomerase [Martelella radicis]